MSVCRRWTKLILCSLALTTLFYAQAMGDGGPRFSISLAKGSIEGVLNLSSITEQLLKLSPMELEMRDFNHREKIAMPPKKLDLAGVERGFRPVAGDIGIYAPWGNICIFYHDADYSDGLIRLGKITSGLEIIQREKGEFKAVLNISK